MPQMSQSYKDAGIIKFISIEPYDNGSWAATVALSKVILGGESNPRKINQKHVREIAADFDVTCIDPPKLVYDPKSGVLVSLNGQHTILAALINGKRRMKCNVFLTLTERQMLRIFYECNMKSKKMNTWTAYGVALRAKYTWATAIRRQLIGNGFSTPNDRGFNTRTANIRSLQGLMEAYSESSTLLKDVVGILANAFGGENGLQDPAGECEFIRGVLDLRREYREWCAADMAELLARTDAYGIERMAATNAIKYRRRPNRGDYFYALNKVYNRPYRAAA